MKAAPAQCHCGFCHKRLRAVDPEALRARLAKHMANCSQDEARAVLRRNAEAAP